MQRPIEVDLPHQLGREEAKARIAGNLSSLPGHIPGGVADVKADWAGDTLNLVVGAMGQEVTARIDVAESNVHCRIELPGFLALFAAPIEALLRSKGDELLLEDHRED